MLNGKDTDQFEEDVKKQFINEPAQMKLLIVVDKLLTGFDAPSATYLYIDKNMQDHGLFQAICRVNRLDGEDKQIGFVVDYKDLFKSLEKSIKDYTNEVFSEYDKDDVEGLLKDRLEMAQDKLDTLLESIRALCEPVAPPKDTLAYIRYFCAQDTSDKEALKENEEKRVALYKITTSLIRAYSNIANEMIEAGYTFGEAESIHREVNYYDSVRAEIMLAAGDYIDLKSYEPAMRHLIDNYISSEESKKLSAFEDMTLVDLIVDKGVSAIDNLPEGIKKNKDAAAETIENNVRRLITDEMVTNPKYYENMSVLLDDLIKKRKEETIAYEEYLNKIVELAKQTKNPGNSSRYPSIINTPGRRALYDNLDGDEELAVKIDIEIKTTKPDNWRATRIKKRVVENAIKRYVYDEEVVSDIMKIAESQTEY